MATRARTWGDEFTIHALDRYGEAFERVNVSYEYWEYAAAFTRQSLIRRGDVLWDLRVVGTFMHTWDRGDPGFYSTRLLDGRRPVVPSARNYEPSMAVELLPGGTVPENGGWLGSWRPLLSLDARWKTVYDYTKTDPDEKEEPALSTAVVVGLRHVGGTGRGRPDLIFKAYRGVNPNGQFWNQTRYWMIGLGVRVRV